MIPALGAADAGVLVDFPDFPARPIRHRTQFAQLVVGVLFGRADPKIDGDALFYGFFLAEPTMLSENICSDFAGEFRLIAEGFLV